MASMIIKLATLFLLILVNAFFSAGETAIITLNDNKMNKMADDGHKKAKKIIKLTNESAAFLSTTQIGMTLASFLVSASASRNFLDLLSSRFIIWFGIETETGASTFNAVALVVITLITSYFALVLGELVPKKIAMQKPEPVAFFVVNPLLVTKAVFSPFIKLLSVSANTVIRIIGLDPHASEEVVTEEEIRMLVDVGEEKGVIEETQREMINNIFEFDDITVGEIMRHRTEISAVSIDSPLSKLVEEAIEEGYSRIPVFEEDLDNIVGIIYVKDLLQYVGKAVPKSVTPRDLMRFVHHVPETKKCGELFTEMTEQRISMAVIVDEYGGTAGLITLEDLIESIVGKIEDEYDDEADEITEIDEDTFIIEGTTLLDEVNEMLQIALPDGDYDTIGGFIISLLGRIPKEDETPEVEACGYTFTVEKIEEKRIERICAKRIENSA